MDVVDELLDPLVMSQVDLLDAVFDFGIHIDAVFVLDGKFFRIAQDFDDKRTLALSTNAAVNLLFPASMDLPVEQCLQIE